MAQESAELIRVVSDAQVKAGTSGSVGEIGVHHGRLFILLYLLAQPHERAFAVDIFEAQHLNVDHSGHGDRTIFESHLRRFDADMQRIDILAESSLEVSAECIRRLSGSARLFSIDGGHTTEVALNDLELAEATLTDGGVVILDDVFQSLFPGVTAALARYLLGRGKLVPFAVSKEKVLLTQPEQHDWLIEVVQLGFGPRIHGIADFFGHSVAILKPAASFRERLQLSLAQTNAYNRARNIPIIGDILESARPAVLKALGR